MMVICSSSLVHGIQREGDRIYRMVGMFLLKPKEAGLVILWILSEKLINKMGSRGLNIDD